MKGLPQINCFLIGAQKAGTTSLDEFLSTQSDVCAPSELKDYHHFSLPDEMKKLSEDEFMRFYRDNSTRIKVHSAVNYLYFEDVAQKIYDYNSDAKIIVCIRDPKERLISAYKYFLRTHRESRDFAEALNYKLEDLLTYTEQCDLTYYEHSNYENINTWIRLFGRQNVCVVHFEMMINDFDSVKVELSDFLGIYLEGSLPQSNTSNSGVRSELLSKAIYNSKLKLSDLLPARLALRLGKLVRELNTVQAASSTVEVDEKHIDLSRLNYEYYKKLLSK